MKIRRAKKKDIKKLVELWKGYEKFHKGLTKQRYMKKFLETDKNSERLMKKYFLKAINSKDSDILLTEVNKRIVGFIYLNIYNAPKICIIKKLGHIGYFYVEKEFREKGAGKKLMKEAMEWFKKRKIKRISFEVNALNQRARDYYKRRGFKDFEIIMMKDLK
jgi:ribosomal protein S18 acetylase RimI-like enzyme